MSTTPRGSAKPAKKTTKKKAPTGTIGLQKLVNVEELTEDAAKEQLSDLQKKYGTLVVNFNNQKVELGNALATIERLEREYEKAEQYVGGATTSVGDKDKQIAELTAELKASEVTTKSLQAKVEKLSSDVAGAEEIDMLFMSLEKVESDLAEVTLKKEQLEEEVLTARQLTARGGTAEPKFIEIHHHNDLEDDSDNDDAKPPAPPPPAP